MNFQNQKTIPKTKTPGKTHKKVVQVLGVEFLQNESAGRLWLKGLPSLKVTYSTRKWMVGILHFLLGWPIFRCYVSFNECNPTKGKIPSGIPEFRTSKSYPSSQQKKNEKTTKTSPRHLDDMAESFLMSAFRNGSLRTMKAVFGVFLEWSFHMFGDFAQNPRGFVYERP